MISIFNRATQRWWRSNPGTHGAALAYYSIFSLAPICIVLIFVVGQIFGEQVVVDKLTGGLRGFIGPEISFLLQALISYTHHPVQGFVAISISIGMIIVGALALWSQAHRSLEDIWKEHHKEKVASFFKSKILAISTVVILGILLISSFIISSCVSLVARMIDPSFPYIGAVIRIVNIEISFSYIAILFAFMYKYLPHKHVGSKAALVGGVCGAILFIVGRILLGFYIAQNALGSVYGAAGAVILVLVWFYYTAQIFFYGAALTYAIDQTGVLDEISLPKISSLV